jgi:hypothetical protein
VKRKYTCGRCGKQGHGSNHCHTPLRKARKRQTPTVGTVIAGLGGLALGLSMSAHPCCEHCIYKLKYEAMEELIDTKH